MLASMADQNDDQMTLSELGVVGLFDDEVLANDHEVSRALSVTRCHTPASAHDTTLHPCVDL